MKSDVLEDRLPDEYVHWMNVVGEARDTNVCTVLVRFPSGQGEAVQFFAVEHMFNEDGETLDPTEATEVILTSREQLVLGDCDRIHMIVDPA